MRSFRIQSRRTPLAHRYRDEANVRRLAGPRTPRLRDLPSVGYTWTEELQGGGNETPGEFFERLILEHAEEEAGDDDAPAPADELSMPALARIVMEMCSPFPFRVEGETHEEIEVALAEILAKEMQSVQGYVQTWRSTAALPKGRPGEVVEETAAHVAKDVFAWPSVMKRPLQNVRMDDS